MNGLDVVIVVVIASSVLIAAAQGFFFEIISLAGAVLGFLLASWQYQALAPVFAPYVAAQPFANLAAYLTIFFSVLLLAGVTGRVARWLLHGAGLRLVDRALGAAFGLVRGVVVVTVALMALAMFAPKSPLLVQSSLGRHFLLAGNVAIHLTPGEVKQKFYNGMALLRELRSQAQGAAE